MSANQMTDVIGPAEARSRVSGFESLAWDDVSKMSIADFELYIKGTFEKVDVTGNGNVDKQELWRLVGFKTDLESVERAFARSDTNSDFLIEYAEFRDIMLQHYGKNVGGDISTRTEVSNRTGLNAVDGLKILCVEVNLVRSNPLGMTGYWEALVRH